VAESPKDRLDRVRRELRVNGAPLNGNGHPRATDRDRGGPGPSKAADPTTPIDVPELATRRLDTVRIEPIEWLVDQIIPSGMFTNLAGEGGLGKSSVTLDLAADVTRGRPAFGLEYEAPPPGEVLLVACEDDVARTTVPRLIAAGADLSKIHNVEGIKTGDKVAPFSLAYVASIEKMLDRHPGIRLIIVDPLTSYVGRAGINDHKDSELRSVLDPVVRMAEERRVAVVGVMHLNKSAAAKAANRVLGGVAYVNLARAVYVVCRDPEDSNRRLLLPVKNNLAHDLEGLALSLDALPLEEVEAIIGTHCGHLAPKDRAAIQKQLYRCAWHGPVKTTADEALSAIRKGSDGRITVVERCAEWVKVKLAKGAILSAGLEEDAIATGQFTADNLKKAKALLARTSGLQSKVFVKQGPWWVGFGDPATWGVPL
jgi:hypothetical protein